MLSTKSEKPTLRAGFLTPTVACSMHMQLNVSCTNSHGSVPTVSKTSSNRSRLVAQRRIGKLAAAPSLGVWDGRAAALKLEHPKF